MKPHHNPDFLTVDQAAKLAGVSIWTVLKWLQAKRLSRYKSSQQTLVSRTELLKLLEPRKVSGQ